MFTPNFRMGKNGVPIISGVELDNLGNELVRDYNSEILKNPGPVDIDAFMEFYLGLTPDYQYLSHNGCYLGMMIFNDTDNIVVYNPEKNDINYISAKANTVIFDNQLLDVNQETRYRFTAGHESSHKILHPQYYSYSPDQLTLDDNEFNVPMVQCRKTDIEGDKTKNTRKELVSDDDWMEWQANRLSSAILMPKEAVFQECKNIIKGGKSIELWQLEISISLRFNVSDPAATIRLKELGISEWLDGNNIVLN